VGEGPYWLTTCSHLELLISGHMIQVVREKMECSQKVVHTLSSLSPVTWSKLYGRRWSVHRRLFTPWAPYLRSHDPSCTGEDGVFTEGCSHLELLISGRIVEVVRGGAEVAAVDGERMDCSQWVVHTLSSLSPVTLSKLYEAGLKSQLLMGTRPSVYPWPPSAGAPKYRRMT